MEIFWKSYIIIYVYIGTCYTAKIMVKIAIFCLCVFFLRAGISQTRLHAKNKLRMTLCVIVVFDEVVLQIELAELKCPCSYLIPGLFANCLLPGQS